MITARRYLYEGVIEDLDPLSISECDPEDGGVLWVDLLDPSQDDLDLMSEEFRIHRLVREDLEHRGQRPKIELYPTHAFVVAYDRHENEVALLFGPTWLMCVRTNEPHEDHEEAAWPTAWDPAAALKRFEQRLPERLSVGALLHTILDTIVDDYFVAFDDAEGLLEDLEDRIFDEEPRSEKEIQQDLLGVRRRLVMQRRHVLPLREVVATILRREISWLADEPLLDFQDLYDHVLRLTDMIDSGRELMGNAVDAHLALISNRMNRVMKRMTSWGAILFGAGLIAGVYGMNFEDMPELGWQLGYPMAIGMMLALTVTLYVWFKKKDWL